MNKVKYCIDNYVPVKSNNKKSDKPKWMDQYCVRKVKKSIMPGNDRNVLHIVIVIEITQNIVNCEIVLQNM